MFLDRVTALAAGAASQPHMSASMLALDRRGVKRSALLRCEPVLDHVTIRVSDREASERFYLTVLPTLGIGQSSTGAHFAEWDEFSIAEADERHPPTRRLHIGFRAPSREHVGEFWRVGTEAGYRDDGPPGPRPQYDADYYGSFLLDPDGNSAEGVHYETTRAPATVDHLWIRVADLGATKRFYETIAPHAALRLNDEVHDRAQFTFANGTISFVPGTPTEHVHVAFAADDDAAVRAFHAAAIEAGYRDNGAPGERPAYHAGYYGAYVLDPDGNNVELVNHHRR
jgi:catechol 2,3-dioxygenase-like lactoylglutathione lyase family enzyme